ncbi:MAG: hypothetical protein C0617_10270 [Desulfuromonas sp.]|nr:MAG: hypothetical protein C0617_10270 [Desulfuromonas sp.]
MILGTLCSGCSDGNSSAPLVSQAHPDGWLAAHPAAAFQDPGSCALCHKTDGPDTGGEFDNPSCFSANYTREDGTTVGCHPDGPGQGGVPHPVGDAWLLPSGHVEAARTNSDPCLGCHVELGIEPACADCHTAGDPLVVGDCASCHNAPPDSLAPAGDVGPNREGAHAGHDALVGVTGVCDTCHQGAGTGSVDHYDEFEPADVAFPATYDANAGPATYSAGSGSCAGLSCHGGQATPAWLDGALEVDAECEACHAFGDAEPNSFESGEHDFHVPFVVCATCHDPARLAEPTPPVPNHFSGLDTPAFEQDPADTININMNYNGESCFIPSPAPPGLTVCHPGQTRDWD